MMPAFSARAWVVAIARPRPGLRCVIVLAFSLLALIAGPFNVAAHSQRSVAFGMQFARLLPGASETKFPSIALAGADVFIGAPNNRFDAAIWQANMVDAPFGMPTAIGVAAGQPDYSPVSVAAADDGSLYAAFIDQESKGFYLRHYVGGTWGPPHMVMPPGSEFRVNLTVGIAGDRVFVFWRSPDAPYSFRSSRDGGLTWTARQYVSDVHLAYGGPLAFASDASGRAYVAYTAAIGDLLQIVVAEWNGTHFVNHSPIARPGRNCADPGIVLQADGTPLVAWREVEGGIYLATATNSGWQTQRFADGTGFGTVALSRDVSGTIAAYWVSDYAGTTELYGALKPLGGSWLGPARVGNEAMFLVNAQADGLLHTVTEAFGGRLVTSRYTQFAAAGIATPLRARPVLNYGAAISADDELPITFADASGAIDEFRWSWGDRPIATAEWFPFSPDARLMPPRAALYETTRCSNLMLATQVRNHSGATQTEAAVTSILLDRAVQTRVGFHNPAAGEHDASNVVTATLVLDNLAECSQTSDLQLTLTAGGAGGSVPAMPAPVQLGPLAAGTRQSFSLLLPAVEDAYTATVQISDEHGHQAIRSVGIEFDRSAPTVVHTGTLALESNPLASLHPTLHISGTALRDWFMDRDRQHREPRIWGLLLSAQRLTPLPASSGGTPLVLPLKPAELSFDAASETERINATLEVPLERLLAAADLLAGEYSVVVQVLDDAGNPSPIIAVLSISLDHISYPPVRLPLVQAGPET